MRKWMEKELTPIVEQLVDLGYHFYGRSVEEIVKEKVDWIHLGSRGIAFYFPKEKICFDFDWDERVGKWEYIS